MENMEYAVHTLQNMSRLLKMQPNLKYLAIEYDKAVECLETGDIKTIHEDVVHTLKEKLSSINDGLKSWGKDYQDERKRQEKRRNQVQNAINFFDQELITFYLISNYTDKLHRTTKAKTLQEAKDFFMYKGFNCNDAYRVQDSYNASLQYNPF